MMKCTKCQGWIPEFSIEWSETHDEDKCACSSPGLPAPPWVHIFERIIFAMKQNWK